MNPRIPPEAIIAAFAVRGLLDLIDQVCARRGVTREQLCGDCPDFAVSAARHELWWLIRHHPERRYSYSEIGRLVRRHSTTVVYGVTRHATWLAAVSNHHLP